MKIIAAVFALFAFIQPIFAVNLSQNSTGQALLLPHYQANANSHTEFSVTNSRAQGKALKVRFMDPVSGEYVTGFHLYLDARATWVGQIQMLAGKVTVTSSSKACVLAGPAKDLPARGSIEILEMGVLNADINAHDCKALEGFWSKSGRFYTEALNAPSGGLFGKLTLFYMDRVFTIQPLALEGWRSTSLHLPPHDTRPDLSDVYPKTNYILDNGRPIASNWTKSNPAAPVTALLMTSTLVMTYQSDPAKRDQTDFLLSFPTKAFYPEFKCIGAEIKFLERPANGVIELQPLPFLSCSSDNVLSINDDRVLGLAETFALNQLNARSGQTHLSFLDRKLVSDEGHIYTGVPVLGYSLFSNNLMGKSMTSSQSGSAIRNIQLSP